MLDKTGYSVPAIIEKHLGPKLEAKTTKFFAYNGKVIDERTVDDNSTHMRAIENMLEMHGAYALRDAETAAQVGVKVIVIDIPTPSIDLPDIFQSGQSSIAGGLAIVTGEGVPESLIDAFIDQDSHLWTCEQEVFRFFKSSFGRFTGHGGKSFQKILNRASAFQVVKEGLDRHASSTKHRSSAENVRVFDDNVHAETVARA